MRLASAWFFVVKDTVAYLRRNKRAVLFALFFVVIGMIMGIIIATSIEEAEYLSILNQMFINTYSSFGIFFNFALITLICMSITYLCLISKWTRLLPYFILVYYGYIIGRAIILNIVICKFVGFISLLIFLMPAYIAMVWAIVVFIMYIRDVPCGYACINPFCSSKTLKYLAKCFLLCVCFYFSIFVILGGIMSIILNIA